MKKNLFIFFILLFSSFSFAFELWNGFTDDMTPEQVLERGNKIFECEAAKKLSDINDYIYEPYPTESVLVYKNKNFPIPDYCITYKVKEFVYASDTVMGNVLFFFYKGKLCEICVVYNKSTSNSYEKISDEMNDILLKNGYRFSEEPCKHGILHYWIGKEMEVIMSYSWKETFAKRYANKMGYEKDVGVKIFYMSNKLKENFLVDRKEKIDKEREEELKKREQTLKEMRLF